MATTVLVNSKTGAGRESAVGAAGNFPKAPASLIPAPLTEEAVPTEQPKPLLQGEAYVLPNAFNF